MAFDSNKVMDIINTDPGCGSYRHRHDSRRQHRPRHHMAPGGSTGYPYHHHLVLFCFSPQCTAYSASSSLFLHHILFYCTGSCLPKVWDRGQACGLLQPTQGAKMELLNHRCNTLHFVFVFSFVSYIIVFLPSPSLKPSPAGLYLHPCLSLASPSFFECYRFPSPS